MATELINPGFEDGTLTGWSISQSGGTGTASVDDSRPYSGLHAGKWLGASGTGPAGGVESLWMNDARGPVYTGQSVGVNVQLALEDTSQSQNRAEVRVYWLRDDDSVVSYKSGTLIRGNNSSWRPSAVTDTAPAGATKVAFAVWATANYSGGVLIDNATWNYTFSNTATLSYPQDGQKYAPGESVPFRVALSGPAKPAVLKVEYYDGTTLLNTQTASPFSFNSDSLAAGSHTVSAKVYYDNGAVITTNSNTIQVVAPDPIVREFKASNSYTYLVGENFSKLASGLPPTAVVTGAEIVIDYKIRALIRSKDLDLSDVSTSRYQAAFDMVPAGNLSAALLSKSGSSYSVIGSPVTENVPIDRSEFVVIEDGLSDGHRWTVLEAPADQVVVGADNVLFGVQSIPATEFPQRSVGVRFYPTLGPKPDYADSGDACFRFFINRLRLRVYFDAGSVEYYFVSPDGTNIIKGRLAAYCVDDGDFANGDASGDLQLTPDLEVIQGTATAIGPDWTIHAQQPPTDDNKIGDVVAAPDNADSGMAYNGLPGQAAIVKNRSRYQMISANFYGDPSLDSIYGVHGLPRAFSYNGEFFYKICTQPDPEKDKPRHVAYHQTHLALGYAEGRVDISVVGQPYNFDGAQGASSWATGDKVTGLSPLSGTILGVFGSKSIVGISGTTVDNFATQTLSPKIGATEYTVTDMGFPVYANSNGIYTLEQTASYGSYLGIPLSQPISPWIRPRLLRSLNSNKEVVCAWPVRSKNQYRLAFSDGFVLSQTMNGGQQSAPTYSFQKYYITNPGDDPNLGIPLLEYPAIYPIAVSSELDVTGEEKIHVANLANKVET